MKQSWLSMGYLHTLQSSLQFRHAVVRRQHAEANWEPAIPAEHAHERGRWDVLALDFPRGPRELTTFDGAGDDATWADSRLLVVRLRGRPTEWAAEGAVDHLGVEGELRPTLPRRPGQDLALPGWLAAVRARRRARRRPGRLRS